MTILTSHDIVPGSDRPKGGEDAQEIIIMRICGPMGSGKSSILADYTISAAIALFGDEETEGSDGLIITNMHFDREQFPRPIRKIKIYQDGNIRHIIEKLAEKNPCVLALDELDKGISSSQRASVANQIITSVASDSRKYRCKFLVYSSIPRKGVDSRIRASDTYVVLPKHTINVDGFAQFWIWNDPEKFESDYVSVGKDELGYGSYEYGVTCPTTFQLSYLQTVFHTLDRIPINFEGLLDMEEINPTALKFLDWCRKTEVNLVGMRESHVKKFMDRWNYESKFVLPFSPKNLDLLYTELLRMHVFDEPQSPSNNSADAPVTEEPKKTVVCQRCKNSWSPRTDSPKKCPRCQSPYWRDSE